MMKKLVALVLLFILSAEALVTVCATDNQIFTLTDGKTDLTYTVTLKGSKVTVSNNGEIKGTTYVNNICACSLYDGLITFYSVDNLNSVLVVYFYDFLKDSIDSVAVNADALYRSVCFATDRNGCVYFVSNDYVNTLCKYESGIIEKVNLNFDITQLLCVDGENIIVVTTKYTYLYNGSEAVKILDSPLSAPAYYIGGGIIKDSTDTEYIYENGKLGVKPTYTEAVSTRNLAEPPTQNGTYVAETGVTVSKIKKAFADLEIKEVRKADGSSVTSGKLGTGALLLLSTEETVTVIIYGELTGEGNINSRDLTAILNHLSEKELLTGSALLAADVNKDGVITTKDALLISLMY